MYVLNPNKCVLLFRHLNNEVEVTRISILHTTYIGLNIMWKTKLLFRKKIFSISYCIVSAHRICGKPRSINTHIYSYKITKNRWIPCLIFFFFNKFDRLIWSAPRIGLVRKSITLSSPNLEYFPINAKNELIVCYGLPC